MGKKAFITGTTGQDGSYLSEFLLDKGYTVYGLVRRSSTGSTQRIAHIVDHPEFNLVDGDVTDASCMSKLISGIKPDEVYNLAAMSHVGDSFNQPMTTCHIDAVGPLNILEAIRQNSPSTRFYQASTSELFGNTPMAPQGEDTPFSPDSPYAVAKLYAHHMVGLYRRAYDIFACAGILFNHESPRRGEDFVTRKITKYVASLAYCMDRNYSGFIPKINIDTPPLYLGNLSAKRDWSHAKDMVRGMWLMMQQDEPMDFVLGSGQTRSIKDFLEVAFGCIGLDYNEYVLIDQKFYRPVDVNLLQADFSNAKKILQWSPEISFEEMVRQMITSDYDLCDREFNFKNKGAVKCRD